ncbi:DUF538 domain-containing protein [Gossypium australe]|uniref:DUF538 domain-containing protein n=1 Tax=Gossypium australe TaxID=47621 RepID=A0A5B6ULT5_9ROSI|nr:DUF538 domain-containing protein [Gossypium australe]
MMIPLIVSTFIHLVFIFAAVSCEKDSIYDILKAHGLPMGLLPKGISRFDIDDTGRFEVHLDQACNAMFESQLHFDTNVSGTLSYGQIGALSGIAAQELFLWFPVKGIGVDVPSSGLIYFDVGVVVKQLPLSMFETPKDCMAVGDFESGDSILDDDLLAESIAKSQSAKLGHELDQGSLGGTICRKPTYQVQPASSYARMADERETGNFQTYIFDDHHGWHIMHLDGDFRLTALDVPKL